MLTTLSKTYLALLFTGLFTFPAFIPENATAQQTQAERPSGQKKTTAQPNATHKQPVQAIINDFYHRPDQIMVTAHRADHSQFPENSLASIDKAIREGIDIVELDIRETKDSVLVLMHDKNIDRTTTGKGLVSSFTYKELQDFYLLQDGRPGTEKIPTFEEVLKLTKGKIMIDIDFKEDTGRASRETYRLLSAYGMEKQVLFFVYDYKDVPGLRSLNKKVPIMPRANNKEDVQAILAIGGFPVIHVDDSFYSEEVMGSIRKAGVRVWTNALGKFDKLEKEKEGSGFSELLKMKQVNVIQTDRPEQLLVWLRQNKLHR